MEKFYWSFVSLILLLNYDVVFVSASCIWYDECGDGWNGGKLNCNYTGPAKPLTNVTGLSLLQTYCPDLYHGNDSVTCCSTNQLMTIAHNMDLSKQFFSRCLACYHNFLNIYCDMTCNPDQDKFVWVNNTRKNPDKPFYHTEQVLISRPASQQTPITHTFPPPSDQTMNFTSLFDKDFMKEVLQLQTNIINLVALWNGRKVTLSDICFKPLAPDYEDCTIESPMQYYQNDPQNLDKVAYDESGFYVVADYLDQFLHCVQAPASISDTTPLNMSCLSQYGAPAFPWVILGGFDNNNYQNSTAFVLTFIVNNHLNEEDNAMAEAWEKVFINYMKNYKNDHMIISFSSEVLK